MDMLKSLKTSLDLETRRRETKRQETEKNFRLEDKVIEDNHTEKVSSLSV